MPLRVRDKFPKSARLKKRPEFLSLSRTGKKFHSPNFIVISKSNEHGESRLGITVSGKVGNAVTRNRVKRLIREFFRLNKDLFEPVDYNVIAKQGAARLDFGDICRELDRALQRSKKQLC